MIWVAASHGLAKAGVVKDDLEKEQTKEPVTWQSIALMNGVEVEKEKKTL